MRSAFFATIAAMCVNALAADVSVVDFGGVGDGRADCTEAFARAVAAASGGGAVIVPAGEWLTGPIHLKSGVELRLGKGAVVSFKPEPAAYLPAVKTTWGGVECMNYSPLVYAYGCTNVSITGEGALSPRMEVWRTWCCRPPKHKAAMMRLYEWCCEAVPVEERRLSDLPESNMRPQLVQFNRCRGVRVEGIEIRDSPCWSVHFFMCRDVVMRGVSSRGTAWNTDGVDIEASRDVLVENCVFDQHDDGVVVKSGRDRDGWRLATPSENIVVRNCRFKNAHTMLAVGTEISGGVRNVLIENCEAGAIDLGSGNLFSVKTNRRRGGFLKDITCENVKARSARLSVFEIATDVLYEWADFPDYENRTTKISDIKARNIEVGVTKDLIRLVGDPAMPPERVSWRDVSASSVTGECRRVSNVLVEDRP